MNAARENRVSQRIPQNIPIRFSLAAANGMTPAPDRHDATVIDISATGMGISSPTPLRTGQVVLFDQEQPNWQLPPRGLVIWCLKDQDRFRAGIEFSM